MNNKKEKKLCFINLIFFFYFIISTQIAKAQTVLYCKDAKAENRTKLFKNLTNSINRNLSLPLTDSTEENWMDAFYAIELLRFKSPLTENKLHEAFKNVEKRSGDFQNALIEVIYDLYPSTFEKEVVYLFDTTLQVKCFAACGEYLIRRGNNFANHLAIKFNERIVTYTENPILKAFFANTNNYAKQALPPLKDLLNHRFFENNKVVFSFQRKNRNYPGLAVVRDSAGNFVKDNYGGTFCVPQLARSISNLPSYISNGNTPQGIFRMYGFDTSKSNFIGPTPNIQLTMPIETSTKQFINDTTVTDSVWTLDWYRDMLPKSWQTYTPIYGSYFAGAAGRNEIIAHGTTVNPEYYRGQPYYPFTPTLGCLCTKEIWSEEDGRRLQSGQQQLIDAVKKAGGANGYYIVIELNDEQKPVDINEIITYLK